ncbi:platelet-derived growth factor receptor alpha isoform X2 [Nematostella vectensis]|uniref:platelet-derived growth factor receptor alpha isoform X2 n=1 Tax=Nematostella vectensis TaxID=45351 RepID=UPI002076D738|nr:platelet-derived growth factor receptor alpha isoform X2 [Nematostella vectensis]
MSRLGFLGGRWTWHAFTVVIALFVISTQVSSSEFKFLVTPLPFATVAFGANYEMDCRTNDKNATTSLFFRKNPTFPSKEKYTEPKKLIKVGDIYSIIYFGVNDFGAYQCRATNASGFVIQNVEVNLYGRPDVTPDVKIVPDQAVVLTIGQHVNLTCISATQTTLKWLKQEDGSDIEIPLSQTVSTKDVNTNQHKLILMIKDTQLAGDAMYKCLMIASNGKQNFKLASVIIYAPEKPNIISKSANVTRSEGATVQIDCLARGYPYIKSFKWFIDGKEITVPNCKVTALNKCENWRYIMSVQVPKDREMKSFLTIKNTKYPADHGAYRCVAMNSEGQDEATIFINIEAKPVLSKERDVFLEVKKLSTQVECTVLHANPKASFQWEFQKINPLFPDQPPFEILWMNVTGYTITPSIGVPTEKSILYIPANSDPTYFRCIAKNKVGASNWTVQYRHSDDTDYVKIKFPLYRPTTVDEHDILEIHCIAFKQLVNSNGVQFLRGKQVLSSRADPRVNITKTNLDDEFYNLKLTIINVTVNDSGMYVCDAVGLKPKRFINDSVNINVKALAPPKVSGLLNQTVKRERVSEVKLFCTATGHPTPKITWFKGTPQGWGEITNILNLVRETGCSRSQAGFFFYQDSMGSPLIICEPNNRGYSGTYKCVATNKLDTDFATGSLNVLEKAKIVSPKSKTVLVRPEEHFNQSCHASGNPVPKVMWMRPGKAGTKVLSTGQGSALLVIDKMSKDDIANYTYLPVSSQATPLLTTGEVTGIVIGCVAFVFFILIIFGIMYWRHKQEIKEYREIYFLRTGQSDYKLDPDRSLLEQCNDLPYDHDFEFPEERLVLGKSLGQGAFGQVLRAEAIGMSAFKPRDKAPEAVKMRDKFRRSFRKKGAEYNSMRSTKTTVAVKCLKEGASESDYKDLASELKILIHVGEHKNIVNVLGACTRGRRLMVIIEFAPYGNLLSFLRARREVFEPTWTKTNPDPEAEYTLVDTSMASYQISKGMEFLARKKCVHRDLAARNVLVGPDYVMKVSDFGLARDIYQDDLYVKTTSGLLPVKWMAPESLFDRVYTEKTDVWSFGILLWEIMTLGGTPYPGLPTEQLLDYLSEGQRMAQPQNCPLEIYTIMRDCWMQLPDQRPHFGTLVERLGNVLERNVAKDNPYLQLLADDKTGATDYYLTPCDERLQRKRTEGVDGYEEPNTSPLGEPSSRYNSPLPSLPPDVHEASDDEIANSPLPSVPPSYDEATKRNNHHDNHGSAESGIDVNDKPVERAEEQRLLLEPPDDHEYVNANADRGKGKGKGKRLESLV